MSLEQQISKGIMEAMKAKDTVRLRTDRRGQGPDRRGRRHVDEGDGQGDGRGFEEARGPRRRQGHFGQG